MTALLALCSIAPAVHAQHARHTIITRSTRAVKERSASLTNTRHAVPLTVDMERFRTVATDELRLAAVPIAPDRSVDLDLHAWNIIAPDATITATGANGPVPLSSLSIRMYRGTVVGAHRSSVYLAFSDGNLIGHVTIDGKEYDIATDNDAPSSETSVAAVAYPASDLPGGLVSCGINAGNIGRLGDPTLDYDSKGSSPNLMAANDILYSVKGAFDGDFEYFNLFGDAEKAADYMIATIGRVSEVFERDLSCQLVIGYLNVWTTNTDPYEQAGVMDIALDEAKAYWRKKPTSEVDRGFHHIFSGKPWVNPIGIAYLNVLCRHDRGGAFSAITKTNPARDQRVVAHETGHVFGAKHTHNCGWDPEIDRCAPAEEGSCFGSGDIKQGLGTIMSYCSQSELVFGDKVSAWLKNRLQDPGNNTSCVVLSRKLTVDPLRITFPAAELNTPQDTSFTTFFQNNGKMAVNISKIEMIGTNMNQFAIESPETLPTPSNPLRLEPGATLKLELLYLAEINAPSQGVMKIHHDGLNPPVEVTLEAYADDSRPDFTFRGTSSMIDFRNRKVGDLVDTTFATLYSNFGKSTLHITSTEIVGEDRFEFQLADGSAPIELGKDASHTATIRFAPKTPGKKTAWLRIESNSKGHPADSLKLVADVRQGPLLIVKTPGLVVDFGECQRGPAYDTTFDEFFINGGSDDLLLNISAAQGPHAALFNTTLSGLSELGPGQSDELGIGFQAGASEPDGWKQAYIALYNESQDAWDTVHLIARIGNVGAVPGDGTDDASLTIAPNPAAGDAEIMMLPLAGEIGAEYTLRIVDAAGREVARHTGRFTGDSAAHRIEEGSLPAGIYHVSVTSRAGTRTRAVTITR